MIALALVLMQQPEARVAAFRKRLAKVVEDKHEEVSGQLTRAQGRTVRGKETACHHDMVVLRWSSLAFHLCSVAMTL